MIIRGKSRELVLITGAHGFLGQHVVRLFLEESKCDLVITAREKETLFADIGSEPRVLGYHALDIAQHAMVKDTIAKVRPDVIVNCAAFVKVDEAEIMREAAWRANVSGVEYLSEAARKVDARIVHISSDLVFDGLHAPYTESDAPHPINYYGRTKLASENVLRTSGLEHTIFRTCLLYGAAEQAKANYALSVVLSLEAGKPVFAATDMFSTPTLVDDLALAIVRATERRRLGLYHVAGPEMLPRYEFAQRIAEVFRLDSSLVYPTTIAELKKRGPSGENSPTAPPPPRAERPARNGLVSLKAQTDLALKISKIEDGLQVMERGLHELLGTGAAYIYE
ncbi:MAG: NAD(P)-dependent oxidoreductase [Bacteroidota bacterium]|nr:NAD(P)-dependent oxidoreductase [Bacteroidota bacterium]MDP4232381.1 NAD(P)-dependent oxidoreductase [Bacteroidota bacterium]MDP4241518.1 NAD(P)-dependent oxidoreductase [Bacteroidota bacterium]MDP4288252.1 NAD(P)-dependent oxidoreductase [Bacteroidota bacterium]